ncbi:hypothetical protein ACET3Z_019647 [Daucus carota]
MSTTIYMHYIAHIYILLFLFPLHESLAARALPSSGPSTTMAPLATKAREYAIMKMRPMLDQEGRVFHGKQVKACMPKGRRHSSAPSRYVNFHTFDGLLGCESSRKSKIVP